MSYTFQVDSIPELHHNLYLYMDGNFFRLQYLETVQFVGVRIIGICFSDTDREYYAVRY